MWSCHVAVDEPWQNTKWPQVLHRCTVAPGCHSAWSRRTWKCRSPPCPFTRKPSMGLLIQMVQARKTAAMSLVDVVNCNHRIMKWYETYSDTVDGQDPSPARLKHSVHNYVMKLDILPYQLLQAFVHSIQDIMFPPWKSRECKTWTSKLSCDASTCLDDNPGFEIFARWSSRGQCCPRPGRVPGLERFSYEDMLRLGFVMKCHEYHWISNRYYRIWQNIK